MGRSHPGESWEDVPGSRHSICKGPVAGKNLSSLGNNKVSGISRVRERRVGGAALAVGRSVGFSLNITGEFPASKFHDLGDLPSSLQEGKSVGGEVVPGGRESTRSTQRSGSQNGSPTLVSLSCFLGSEPGATHLLPSHCTRGKVVQGGAGLCLGAFGGLMGSCCFPPTLSPGTFQASLAEWDVEAPGCALARALAWSCHFKAGFTLL